MCFRASRTYKPKSCVWDTQVHRQGNGGAFGPATTPEAQDGCGFHCCPGMYISTRWGFQVLSSVASVYNSFVYLFYCIVVEYKVPLYIDIHLFEVFCRPKSCASGRTRVELMLHQMLRRRSKLAELLFILQAINICK